MGVIILVIVLFVGGIWGILMNIYDELEEVIFNPILKLIADQTSKKSLILFIPVAIVFMTVRRAVGLLPLWGALYFIMTTGYGYTINLTYQVISIMCICSGAIKAGGTIRDYYNPPNRYYNRY